MLTVPDCGERLKLTDLDDEISRSRGEDPAPSPSEDVTIQISSHVDAARSDTAGQECPYGI